MLLVFHRLPDGDRALPAGPALRIFFDSRMDIGLAELQRGDVYERVQVFRAPEDTGKLAEKREGLCIRGEAPTTRIETLLREAPVRARSREGVPGAPRFAEFEGVGAHGSQVLPTVLHISTTRIYRPAEARPHHGKQGAGDQVQ